ncbi:P2X purinoceptor 5 isoform X1 [Eschrichtius robustus]|uniref:P2X purinoceptor 5 isoform X1 n=1 Tax=Eschrichtius robustus TaxID=9764 RepID=UPI0035BEC70A
MGQAGCKGLYQSLLDYKTEKYVIAKNKKVGLLYRLLQVSILTYLVVWVFLVKKCYQDTDSSLQSSIVTKVKGVTFTNTSELGERLWDVADYVIPPQGENVFFVITNLVVTPNQRQETCAESESIPDALCCEDSDCPPGEPVVAGNGVRTGRCLRAGSEQKGTCEIFAWCPVETKSRPAKPLLGEAEDFTVYIKNFIRFPKFNFSKTNVLDTTDRAFLKSCKYGPKDPYCPIFRLGSVVSWTGSNFQEIAVQGGVIGIQIEWDCDLDRAPSECYPRYYFNRLDNRFSENSLSSGYNFRFAKYYRDAAGVEFRTLFKAYGIRFDVMVNGKAGKFNIIPTIINVGSGVALMGVTGATFGHHFLMMGVNQNTGIWGHTCGMKGSFFCDLVLIYFIKKSHFYRDKKYEEARDLEVLAQMAESSQQSVAPDAAGLAEQPEVQDGGGAQKENGCVCRQLLQPARSGRQGNGKVNVEQLQNLQTVEA